MEVKELVDRVLTGESATVVLHSELTKVSGSVFTVKDKGGKADAVMSLNNDTEWIFKKGKFSLIKSGKSVFDYKLPSGFSIPTLISTMHKAEKGIKVRSKYNDKRYKDFILTILEFEGKGIY